jgi:hypothetical protein
MGTTEATISILRADQIIHTVERYATAEAAAAIRLVPWDELGVVLFAERSPGARCAVAYAHDRIVGRATWWRSAVLELVVAPVVPDRRVSQADIQARARGTGRRNTVVPIDLYSRQVDQFEYLARAGDTIVLSPGYGPSKCYGTALGIQSAESGEYRWVAVP